MRPFLRPARVQVGGAESGAQVGTRVSDQPEAQTRLAQRRRELAPWVDENHGAAAAGRWLEGDTRSCLAPALRPDLHGAGARPGRYGGVVREDQVLFSGDIMFFRAHPLRRRCGQRRWLAAMDELLGLKPKRWCRAMARFHANRRRISHSPRTTCAICARPWARQPKTMRPSSKPMR